MAEKLFLSVLNMTITASWVILAICLARLLLRRLPSKYAYALWAAAGFRLLCPFSISTAFSLFNLKNFGGAREGSHMTYVPADIGYARQPRVDLGAAAVNDVVNNSLPAADAAASVNPMQIWIFAGTCVWIAGMAVLLVWAMISLLRTKKAVRFATKLARTVRSGQAAGSCESARSDGGPACGEESGALVYECENIPSPFVLGFFQPRIYIPYHLNEQERTYILAHEKYHIRRLDHWTKILAFLLLALHWFNPLVWAAYLLMGKDMEMSCDEAVLAHQKEDVRTAYSQLLLSFSVNRRHFSPGPLAFGESDVAQRIKNVLRFRNPKVWMSALGIAAVALIAAACMTNGDDTSVYGTAASNSAEAEHSGAAMTTGAGTSDEGTAASDAEDSAAAKDGIDASSEDAADTGAENGNEADADRNAETGIDALLESQLQQWAMAFCDRDGETLLSMCTEAVKQSFIDRDLLTVGENAVSFGMSSPWPWQSGADYLIGEMEDNTADILYYAQTSDPHVKVWRETVAFSVQEDGILVESESLRTMDYICCMEEFLLAYPYGIDGTEMDYLTNGMGEALNSNALLSSSRVYEDLFSPERAVISLLNLLDNANKVQISELAVREDGSVAIQIYFAEDGGTVELLMVQPYGETGIWIPQNMPKETREEEYAERYSDYEIYQEMLGDGFLEDFYELDMALKTDVADGLEGETVEVYAGNVGDGDSGFVLVKDENGRILYDAFAHAARAGWNNIYLCEDRYLMTLHMEDRDSFGGYNYEVFRLDQNGNPLILDQGSFTWEHGQWEQEAFESFAEKLQGYLGESYLLVSTQEGELNTSHVSEAEKYSPEVLGRMQAYRE